MAGMNEEEPTGFETVYKFIGGHGRFQWYGVALVSIQLLIMTWNHLGYIFIGAVPDHWCDIPELQQTSWTIDQIRNISIPKKYGIADNWKYDQCHYYSVDYQNLIDESDGNFERAYRIVHKGSQYNDSSSFEPEKKSCLFWTFDKTIYTSTIVSEFNLVCGRRYLVATIQSSYMIGAIIGNLIFGPINDRILGRRNSTLLSIIMVIIGGFLASFSNSYIMFIAARFLIAIGTAASMQATSVWLLEHCDTKTRAQMYCIKNMFFGAGFAIMPIYAYFIRTWSNLQMSFTLTTLSLLSFYWIFPESPRWLASQGRDEEAIKALEYIAHLNRMPKPNRQDLQKCVIMCQKQDVKPSAENAKFSFLRKFSASIKSFTDLVSTPELRRTTFTIWILFIAVAFVYYGFAFSGANITKNPYLLVFLGGIVEVPASVLPIPFLSRWGRRPSAIGCYVFTSVFAFAIAMTPANNEALRTIEFMLGKLAVAAAFTIVYFILGEVYPTVIRSTGRGTGALVGRFGSTAVPYVADMLTTVYPDLPSVIFGIVILAAAPIALFLPEMKGVEMKDQVEEGQGKSGSRKESFQDVEL